MVDSYISIDTGNSGTKIVYSNLNIDNMNSLFMPSASDRVSSERLSNQLKQSNWIGFPQPEQQAWIADGDSAIVIGQLAEQFSPVDRRSIPKYESALYKILAAIGVIVQTTFAKTRRKIKVQLGLLLPWDEYKDRKRLLGELKKISSEYEFRGHKIRVKIERFLCYPEGGGIAMARVQENNLAWFKQQRLGVLMLGDRNWTGLCFEQGQIKNGASPLEGFSFLLDQIVKNAPCLLDRERLGNAIFNGIAETHIESSESSRPAWSKLKAIRSLATARSANLKESEIEDIDKAIAMATEDWFAKLERFLSEMFPQKLTELSVCGGALPFFKPFIESYFNCEVCDSVGKCSPRDISKSYTPVLADGGMTKTVAEVLQFQSIVAKESAFSVRFADVFSLMNYLKAEEAKKLVKEGS